MNVKGRVARLLLLMMLLAASAMANAGPQWWTSLCNGILSKKVREIPPELGAIERAFEIELSRENRYSSRHMEMATKPLSFLVDEPYGIEIKPHLTGTMEIVRGVELKLFTNPQSYGLNWSGELGTLAQGPNLIVLFEDVLVDDGHGTDVLLSDLMAKEAYEVFRRYPNMDGKVHIQTVQNFGGLPFKREFRHHSVMWIEGNLLNFQTIRTTILAAQYAYEHLANDSRYLKSKNIEGKRAP
jgi:hypothetical protein